MHRPTDYIDERIDLRNFLETLSPQKQKVFRLLSHGYTYAQVATKMGVSESAVKLCVRRVRAGYADCMSSR